MAVYQQDPTNDQFGALYDAAKRMAGVSYPGSLPQPLLAAALAKSNVLSYPNKWAETSCISLMEALAAGLLVVTSDLGALPETSQGFARLVPFDKVAPAGDQPFRYSLQELDRRGFVANYRGALSQAIQSYDLGAWTNRLYEQVCVINRTCTWQVRALEWTQFLERVLPAGKRSTIDHPPAILQ
jgi:glycosyltransferase involved in cell wall biosynthesis